MSDRTLRLAVDRREGKALVLLDDGGRPWNVPASAFPEDCRAEGAVLDVPLEGNTPQWKRARRNRAEEVERQREGAERLERLRRGDPGGDVSL